MSANSKQVFDKLKTHRLYSLILTLTLIFFLHKGVMYALLGSFVPLLFVLVVSVMFIYKLNKSPKAFSRAIMVWSVILILWAGVRLLLSVVNQFVKPIPEGHVHAQLGLSGSLLSVVFLGFGIFLWRNRGRVFS
ncbi:hypothetical protein [Fulvivirga kasyanovii]|uniref:Uncharacterized protein n=1 Tax=Fulvivirga kasyanovii TaxID=396812 RepID=A0ABW9RR91_9BACT|nr:hypothetical protein [Fulvivirga kasyanovii]MTI26709.1 hypothetical protein [Fulvivirga kasyanovii]